MRLKLVVKTDKGKTLSILWIYSLLSWLPSSRLIKHFKL